jgi:hypothetical protein
LNHVSLYVCAGWSSCCLQENQGGGKLSECQQYMLLRCHVLLDVLSHQKASSPIPKYSNNRHQSISSRSFTFSGGVALWISSSKNNNREVLLTGRNWWNPAKLNKKESTQEWERKRNEEQVPKSGQAKRKKEYNGMGSDYIYVCRCSFPPHQTAKTLLTMFQTLETPQLK